MLTDFIAPVESFLAARPVRPLVVVLGPTASGKTAAAIAIAQHFSGEIVNADSRQMYRGLDLGTAKPTADELAAAAHHLVSFRDPAEPLSTAAYRELAEEKIDEIAARGRLPILSGSHTLLISAIVENYQFPADAAADPAFRAALEKEYDAAGGAQKLHARLAAADPDAAAKMPPENKHHLIRALELVERSETIPSTIEGVPRVSIGEMKRKNPRKYTPLLLGLDVPRAQLYEKINARVDAMMAAGLLDEVRALAKKYDRYTPAMRGHGYRELLDFLHGEKDLEMAVAEIKQDTRNYAKRQETWWRNSPLAGEIRWISPA